MRILKKYIPILASVLSSIFMFSVGFSSWLVINTPSVSTQAGFTAYGVETKECITGSDPVMFSYSSLSFLDENGAETNQGTMSVTYILWLDNCKALISSDATIFDIGSISVDFNLTYENALGENTDLFSTLTYDTDSLKRSVSVKVNDADVTSVTNNGTSLSFSHTFSDFSNAVTDSSGVTYFTVVVDYIFDIPKNSSETLKDQNGNNVLDENGKLIYIPSNFRNAFGKYLSVKEDSKTKFITTAQIGTVVRRAQGVSE